MKCVMFWKKNSHGVLVVGVNKEKYMIDTFDEFEQNNQSVANENQNRSDQA